MKNTDWIYCLTAAFVISTVIIAIGLIWLAVDIIGQWVR